MQNAARVNNFTGVLGSGTIVQDRWVLTARHVVSSGGTGALVNPNQLSVRLDQYGGTFNVANVYVPTNGVDIALLELSTTPSNVVQLPLNDGFDETGKLIEVGGYGRYGPAGNFQGFGSFHRAQNVVTSVTNNDLIVWFTRPSNANAVAREGIGASGDSGGTVLLNDGEGQWYLGGVHRAGTITNPENDYGKRGFEVRVSRHKSWINSFFDPLWRSEIEADPGDLNIDGVVDVNDIYAMRDAHQTTVPFTLNKFDLVDDDFIVAEHNVPGSDLDAYIIQGIGTRFGDSNLDKKVDATDYDQLIAGFTGENGISGDWSTGDTDFDLDVDGDDYFELLSNFGFLGGIARSTAPTPADVTLPTLVYEQNSGAVKLWGGDREIDAYQIRTVSEEFFFEQELQYGFAGGLQDSLADGVFQLDLDDTGGNLAELLLGRILPAGLDLAGLEAILETARYSAGPNVKGVFDLVIYTIPEPSTGCLLVFVILTGCWKRRR